MKLAHVVLLLLLTGALAAACAERSESWGFVATLGDERG